VRRAAGIVAIFARVRDASAASCASYAAAAARYSAACAASAAISASRILSVYARA
jgi:hypothetical protein